MIFHPRKLVFRVVVSLPIISVTRLYVSLTASPSAPPPIRSQDQLNGLMFTLNATEPHFIRCFKPNERKIKDDFDAHFVVRQLRYGASGVRFLPDFYQIFTRFLPDFYQMFTRCFPDVYQFFYLD
jgi:hypothetical protein